MSVKEEDLQVLCLLLGDRWVVSLLFFDNFLTEVFINIKA